jgi:DNA polymerase III delta subunit
MMTVLTGDNDYLRQAEYQRLITTFTEQHTSLAVERFDVGQLGIAEVLQLVSSQPFLTSRRLLILENITLNKSLTEHIDQLITAVADTTDVLINVPKFDKRLTLYKQLKKQTDFKEFTHLNEQALTTWLQTEATAVGGDLSASTALYLIQKVGDNQMMLFQELHKLLLYDAKVSRQSIDLLSEAMPQSSIFDLLDAAFKGDKRRTMHLYQDQRRQQVEPQAILAMLSWQIHVLAVITFNPKLSSDDIAKRAKISPFVVRKTQQLARELSPTRVKQLIATALALDVRLKTQTVDADDAVQHFLLSI